MEKTDKIEKALRQKVIESALDGIDEMIDRHTGYFHCNCIKYSKVFTKTIRTFIKIE